MIQHSKEDFGMDVKGKDLLQFYNESKLRDGTKTFLELKLFSMSNLRN